MSNKLYEVLSNMLGMAAADIRPEHRLVEDMNADSLDLVELVMAVEDAFDIEIPNDAIDAFILVSDIEAYLVRVGKIEASKQVQVCDSSRPKFGINQKVLHVKTRNIYTIKGTPQYYSIESTNTPAYAYLDESESVDKIWIRPQFEMEDGRFEALS